MLKAGGYAVVRNGKGTFARPSPNKRIFLTCDTYEMDTWSCGHCNRQQHAPLRCDDTDYFFCKQCMTRICDPCADHPCTPFMKRVDEAEERQERRKQILRMYGLER